MFQVTKHARQRKRNPRGTAALIWSAVLLINGCESLRPELLHKRHLVLNLRRWRSTPTYLQSTEKGVATLFGAALAQSVGDSLLNHSGEPR